MNLILGTSECEFEKNIVQRNELLLVKNVFSLFHGARVAKGPCLFTSNGIFSKGLLGLQCSVLEYIIFLRSHRTYGKAPRGSIEINC